MNYPEEPANEAVQRQHFASELQLTPNLSASAVEPAFRGESRASRVSHYVWNAIRESIHAGLFGAVRAAEHFPRDFQAVTNDATAAMFTGRSQRVNRALKTIEHMRRMLQPNLKRLVIVISTHFTPGHGRSLVKVLVVL